MPSKIVAEYRGLYDKHFEPATRNNLPGSRIKAACFDGAKGFQASYIAVNFGGAGGHADILAANCVKLDRQGTYQASIQLNPILLTDKKKYPAHVVKMILAEEWLEVMVGLRDKKRDSMQKLVDNKLDLLVIFNSLKCRGAWQDSTEQQIALHGALRELLASKESLLQMAAEYSLTETEIKRQMGVNPNETMKSIQQFARAYAYKYNVDYDMVLDRFQFVLGL